MISLTAENKYLMALKRSQMISRCNKFLGQPEYCNLVYCNLIWNWNACKTVPGQTNPVWFYKMEINIWRWVVLQISRSHVTLSLKIATFTQCLIWPHISITAIWPFSWNSKKHRKIYLQNVSANHPTNDILQRDLSAFSFVSICISKYVFSILQHFWSWLSKIKCKEQASSDKRANCFIIKIY